jgi:hypothetical protein
MTFADYVRQVREADEAAKLAEEQEQTRQRVERDHKRYDSGRFFAEQYGLVTAAEEWVGAQVGGELKYSSAEDGFFGISLRWQSEGSRQIKHEVLLTITGSVYEYDQVFPAASFDKKSIVQYPYQSSHKWVRGYATRVWVDTYGSGYTYERPYDFLERWRAKEHRGYNSQSYRLGNYTGGWSIYSFLYWAGRVRIIGQEDASCILTYPTSPIAYLKDFSDAPRFLQGFHEEWSIQWQASYEADHVSLARSAGSALAWHHVNPYRQRSLAQSYPLYLSPKMQEQHLHSVGITGTGKSKFFQHDFLEQHYLGQAGMIDVEGDLPRDTLAALIQKGYIDSLERFDALLYLDWGNDHFVPFNPFAGPGAPQDKAGRFLEALLRLEPKESRPGASFKRIVHASAMVLILNGLPPTAMNTLLLDKGFRQRCLKQVDNSAVLGAFDLFDRLRSSDQTTEIASLLRRAYFLEVRDELRLTLGQPENWIDFASILRNGQSFIINLGGIRDEETRRTVGALLMVEFEQAAQDRIRLPKEQRTPFTMILDEWPAFMSHQYETFSGILNRCRKRNVRLHLACQSFGQVHSEQLLAALENCRLTMAFALGRTSAEIMARIMADVDIYRIKDYHYRQYRRDNSDGTISYPFLEEPVYTPVNEQYEDFIQKLMNLDDGHAYLKMQGVKKPFLLQTPFVPDPEVSPKDFEMVEAIYRKKYQRTRAESEEIARVWLPRKISRPRTTKRDFFGWMG